MDIQIGPIKFYLNLNCLKIIKNHKNFTIQKDIKGEEFLKRKTRRSLSLKIGAIAKTFQKQKTMQWTFRKRRNSQSNLEKAKVEKIAKDLPFKKKDKL